MHITDAAVQKLRDALPGLELLENEPMRDHCSFRIGGPARLMAAPSSAEQAQALLRLLREMGLCPFVLGNGTNLLVTDAGLDRVVVRMGDGMAEIRREGETGLRAGCGVPLARLAQRAQTLGLAGLEFAHGIPGTLGGAACMNAGAYGGELKDVAAETLALDENLLPRAFRGAEQDFSYRHSAFSDGGFTVLSCVLALTPGDPEEIRGRMRELSERRRASQPLELPSAGSTFKRPAGAYAAALIDQAGLKGFAVGGAQVSEKHAGFIVNRGGATFDDVLRLMEAVRETVFRAFGVTLEPEVKIIRG